MFLTRTICSNPSLVKCILFFICSATEHQSAKSLALTPWIGHFLNNGIILFLIYESLVTIKSTAYSRLRRVTLPQSKNSIKLFSKHSSIACWVIINFNITWNPVLYFEFCLILTIKHPSADVNPANQFGYLIFWFLTSGLITGITSGKSNFSKIIFFNKKKIILLKFDKNPPPYGGVFLANFSFSDNPWFIEALIATIFSKPSRLKCSLRCISWKTCFNNKKSEPLWVIKPNLSKYWKMNGKSFFGRTGNWTYCGPCL